MEFKIRVAGKIIRVYSVYNHVGRVCKDYLTDEDINPDVEIRTDDTLITAEQEQILQLENQNHSSRNAETFLVHRLIAESLLGYDTFLMHGAVVAVGEAAYMFTGRSGTGKTTHIKKWLKDAEGAYVVNGDKPFIIARDDGVYACGSPWCGKEAYGKNTIVPLRGIALMERSEDNRMEEVPFLSAFPRLLEQTYQPADADKMRKTLELLKRLNGKVGFYRFRFNNLKDDAFSTAYNTLTAP